MSRRMRLAFGASLLANVFLVGAVGGGLAVLARQGGLHLPGGPVSHPMVAAGDGLPQQDRARFREAVLAALQGGGDMGRAAGESRRQAAALFVLPQFDAAAVAAALDRGRAADIRFRTQVENAAIDFAATLPQHEREILAQGLRKAGTLRHPPAPPLAAPKP